MLGRLAVDYCNERHWSTYKKIECFMGKGHTGPHKGFIQTSTEIITWYRLEQYSLSLIRWGIVRAV